jgi:hypothetical protein
MKVLTVFMMSLIMPIATHSEEVALRVEMSGGVEEGVTKIQNVQSENESSSYITS